LRILIKTHIKFLKKDKCCGGYQIITFTICKNLLNQFTEIRCSPEFHNLHLPPSLLTPISLYIKYTFSRRRIQF